MINIICKLIDKINRNLTNFYMFNYNNNDC